MKASANVGACGLGNLRTAIIGAGAIAKHHLRSIAHLPEFKITGICDVDAERSQAMAREANSDAYTDWRLMLEDGFDAVAICAPHAIHAEITVSGDGKGSQLRRLH